MPIIDKHWEEFTEERWQQLAEQYLLEIRRNSCSEELESEQKEFQELNRWGLIVTNLGLWSPPELLWKFILRTIPMAETDEELGDIAASQMEYLLGRAGADYIDFVEWEAKTNPKFAKALTGCNQYLMTDDIWARVQKLQATAKYRLR